MTDLNNLDPQFILFEIALVANLLILRAIAAQIIAIYKRKKNKA